MKRLKKPIIAIVVLILLFSYAYLVLRTPTAVYDHNLKALYLLEVKPNDAAEFSQNVSRITGHGSGYILGTSDMMSIVADDACEGNAELQSYILDYLGNNQFVCYQVISPQS